MQEKKKRRDSFFSSSRTSLLSVARESSAHAHLLELVVFLSTKEKMERFTKDTNWDEFCKPVLEEAKERMPDPSMLAELLSKKKPPTTNAGKRGGTQVSFAASAQAFSP